MGCTKTTYLFIVGKKNNFFHVPDEKASSAKITVTEKP